MDNQAKRSYNLVTEYNKDSTMLTETRERVLFTKKVMYIYVCVSETKSQQKQYQ